MIRIRNMKDFLAGVMFAAFGLAGLVFGADLEIGGAVRMGPGYFPIILSWGLILIGGTVALRGLALDGPPIEPGRWRPIIFIGGAITAFALLVDGFGIAPATAITIAIASFANPEARWKEVVVASVAFAVFVVAVFVYGLDQPMPIWGR